ncbi:hypothetical protein J3R82DRAFT_8265 [Butyriboletus roseoflavus]|nr:hypothetical protein J3R82DRAFT_8265 [Butyriboletus roseoflavus]
MRQDAIANTFVPHFVLDASSSPKYPPGALSRPSAFVSTTHCVLLPLGCPGVLWGLPGVHLVVWLARLVSSSQWCLGRSLPSSLPSDALDVSASPAGLSSQLTSRLIISPSSPMLGDLSRRRVGWSGSGGSGSDLGFIIDRARALDDHFLSPPICVPPIRVVAPSCRAARASLPSPCAFALCRRSARVLSVCGGISLSCG